MRLAAAHNRPLHRTMATHTLIVVFHPQPPPLPPLMDGLPRLPSSVCTVVSQASRQPLRIPPPQQFPILPNVYHIVPPVFSFRIWPMSGGNLHGALERVQKSGRSVRLWFLVPEGGGGEWTKGWNRTAACSGSNENLPVIYDVLCLHADAVRGN